MQEHGMQAQGRQAGGMQEQEMQARYAPGARMVIRDCEWIVRRADPSDDGGYVLTVDGLSELVSGKSARFLTRLEEEADAIRVLDPAETRFEQDLTPGFEKSRLFIETQRRQITPADARIHLGHKAAMDPVPYQLDPALQALKQNRQRILIADAVGLGKTLEAGILITELMRRGRGKRILVLTLKSMMTQFQKELWNRFTIPLTRLDSAGLQRVRNHIPGNHNPFYYYDKSIISIDTLKQDNEYRRHLEQAYWDIIVIDEAHNVAERGTSSQRARLAQLLAGRSDTLIMLSATPHDGKAKSFASLMNMLDPTAISDPDDYAREDFRDKGLVIRRFKKDIRDQVQQEFKERVVKDIYLDASPQEEAAYQALLDVPFTYRGECSLKNGAERNGQLVRIGLQKAIFSSPAAAEISVAQRIRKLAGSEASPRQPSDHEQAEIQALESLRLALRNVDAPSFGKYQQLLALLKSVDFGWKKSDTQDRLVIFSERIETLNWLQGRLQEDLKLKEEAIQILHGGMSDIEQQAIVEAFGKPETPLRVLLCSDVASEGINLHYLSHRLVHFDLPWSLMVFQQRNGRVDRYGQSETPIITYLINRSDNPKVRGDQRILEILKEKDEQAYRNIGDPATFMKVHDPEAEEALTMEAMAEGTDAAAFDAQYQPDDSNEGDDLLALFLNPEAAGSPRPEGSNEGQGDSPTVERYSLFPGDFEFTRQALEALNRERRQVEFSANPERATITLTPPDDLDYRFRFLPPEIRPEHGSLVLTADKQRFAEEIRRSRQDENAWPKLHYLWPQHPAIQWLEEKLLAQVARHSAPVLALPESPAINDCLPAGEAVFLVSGLIPNRKAHPVIWEWFAIRCRPGQGVIEVLDAESWLPHLGLDGKLPNRARPLALEPLEALRPAVIEAASQKMAQRQAEFSAETRPELERQLAELKALQARQVHQLEMSLEGSRQAEHFKASRREQRLGRIEAVFDDYRTWVEDTLTIEPVPFIQIIAVLTRDPE